MKKKTLSSAEKIKSKARISVAQRDVLISALVCIGLIFAAFYWIVKVEQPRALSQRIGAVTAGSADHQRLVIRNVLEQISRRVDAQANRPSLAAVAGSGGRVDVEPYEKALQKAFPEAVDAKLILIAQQGIADEQSETELLRNNIEIDMLRSAIESKKQVTEAYEHEKKWLISYVQLVSPRVAVFVSFPAGYFQGVLNSLAGEAVSHQLIQTYKKRRDIVIRAANTDFKQYMEKRSLPVPGWTLEVFPQPGMVQSLKVDSTLLWLVCVLCVALISASHAVFFLRIGRAGAGTPAVKPTKRAVAPLAAKPEVAVSAAKPEKRPAPPPSQTLPLPELEESSRTRVSLNCFRAYDIRGIAEQELDDETCRLIGRAIGSEALSRGQSKLLLGRDGRLSSLRIREALLEGLQNTGLNVIDLGLLATPMLHFACRALNIGNAVMITGSHNPADYNGMKISLEFQTLAADEIQGLRKRIEAKDFCKGQGSLGRDSIEQRYIERIFSDVVIAHPLKVVVDAGNGATSSVAPSLFEELGCEVIPLFCEVDGQFPNHPPDPTRPENLVALQAAVAEHGADIGLAFDGDGDRLAVVTASGVCPAADELLMVLAEDMVSRHPGAEILFDVKCSRLLQKLIVERGGRATMWKCGHAYMKQKMSETGALLGGEYSGHIFFNERWYGFDDGLYTAARLLEVLTLAGQTIDQALSAQGKMFSTGELLLPVADEEKFGLIDAFANQQSFSDATINNLDGLRIEFRHGWGLIRASNTGPAITLRFEADSEASLQSIRDSFKGVLAGIDPQLANGL